MAFAFLAHFALILPPSSVVRMITINIISYLGGVMRVPYIQYTKMDKLRLKIPLLPNGIIRKLLNLNKTPLSAYLCLCA